MSDAANMKVGVAVESIAAPQGTALGGYWGRDGMALAECAPCLEAELTAQVREVEEIIAVLDVESHAHLRWAPPCTRATGVVGPAE